ncbi:7955_t:CDS:2, partial [Racocetra persica]
SFNGTFVDDKSSFFTELIIVRIYVEGGDSGEPAFYYSGLNWVIPSGITIAGVNGKHGADILILGAFLPIALILSKLDLRLYYSAP